MSARQVRKLRARLPRARPRRTTRRRIRGLASAGVRAPRSAPPRLRRLDREELDFKKALESQCDLEASGDHQFNDAELEQIEMIEQYRNRLVADADDGGGGEAAAAEQPKKDDKKAD